jgi:hypothetical protein
MTRKFLFIACMAAFIACNNDKDKSEATSDKEKDAKETTKNETPANNTSTTHAITSSAATITYTVDGKDITARPSALVGKDKNKLSPGNDYYAFTPIDAGNNESMNLNFVFAIKPGSYPIVGLGYQRGPSGKGEVYGGLLGGQPRLTDYKVNLTEVKDLGENGTGGHKWSLSGNVTGDIKIGAMKMMLMDKTRKPPHPESITISNIQFSNITFDDNYEELMEKAVKGLKKKAP